MIQHWVKSDNSSKLLVAAVHCVGVCACSRCEEDAQVGRARGRSGDGSWSSQTFCVSLKEGNMICQSTDVSYGCPNQKAMKHEMSGKPGGSSANFSPQSSPYYKLLCRTVME